jgi:hypothetical protein
LVNDQKKNKKKQVGRTEEIPNNHNPDFATPIVLEYRFEEVQEIRFVVVDIDDRSTKSLQKQDFLGEFVSQVKVALFPTMSSLNNLQLHKILFSMVTRFQLP